MKKKSITASGVILRIAAVIFLFVFLFVGYYGLKGYNLYKKATEKRSIEEMIESVKSQENFVSYEELPEIYIDAVISVEDKRFEEHSGIDIRAIGRAVLTDIKTMSMAEGGSTITQQTAKNLLFTQEKHIERKIAEIFAAFAFEKDYTKKEIFEIYVNTIYFGSGYYGIYEASQGYFGKVPSELSDYEAVMLAGIPNAPSDYSPDSNKELAEKRMTYVLKCMVKCEKITADEASDILKQCDHGT